MILTDDAETSVAVAELGKFDSIHNAYITKQAYQVGVLLNSSNASTWTAHQDLDLAFRLLACRFTETEHIYNFGTIVADGNTDLLTLANIERVSSETDTATKFGRVMIGDGIDDDNGKISVPAQPKASKTNYGIVKIGPWLDVDDGVVSAPNYQHADHENYGTVKLSADFKSGNSGELQLANKKDVEENIYQFSNIDIVQNNCIIPKSNFAKYRLFVNEDSLITFDWSQIVIEKDIAFDLEIISDATYVISFDANVVWTLPCAGVLAGKTVIHYIFTSKEVSTEKIGSDCSRAKM